MGMGPGSSVSSDVTAIRADTEDILEDTENLPDDPADASDIEDEHVVLAGLQTVPDADAAANALVRDVIGNKEDGHESTSLAARLHRIDEHAHTRQFVYPDLDDAVSVTAHADAWRLSAAFVEVIPADAIDEDFDIHYVSMTFDANDEYQLNIYAGEVLIASVDGERNTNQVRLADSPIQMVIVPANTQIQVKLACMGAAAANSATVKFKGHRY